MSLNQRLARPVTLSDAVKEAIASAIEQMQTVLQNPRFSVPCHRILKLLADSASMAEKAIVELRLTPDEQELIVSNFAIELERRIPQIVGTLLIVSALPVIGERAVKHYQHCRGESLLDAEDLSQSLVEKILSALVGRWPRGGNIGVWIGKISEKVYFDKCRKETRQRLGMSKLEIAARWLRR